ncbi:ubiquitin activating enzyme [Trypanosoma conorhini]|uniref:Ubiquitin activating enzyme n=1 Tax=Trypanosoma conorhini TaxID=83891 RepID=A0A3R7KHW5_9TRYP|nr:ubiquitin activating enzyme [Trypanosoma conorhini]RNF06803.1 ubiquitin activating enzyme [Trypanosoma conorhini]
MNSEERIRYDRQVRLWGKATQQQLQQTAVRVCGVTAAVAEVAKNLVLAGVRSVAVEDAGAVDAGDLTANFLLQGHALGEARGQACVGRLQALNPYVAVDLTTEAAGASTRGTAFAVALICVRNLDDAMLDVCHQRGTGIDLVVLVAGLGELTMGMFLSKRQSLSYEEQLKMLLATNVSLRPAPFQRALLRMRMTECPEELSFFARLTFARDIVARYNLSQLTREDVEQAASFPLRDQMGTAIEATVAGGILAQLIIREVSCMKDGPGDEIYSWVLCDSSKGIDVQVGHLHGP